MIKSRTCNFNKLFKNMILFVFLGFIIQCSSNNDIKYYSLSSEAFQYSIGLERLDEIKRLLNGDSLFVFPAIESDDKQLNFSAQLANEFPSHIDKWIITPIGLDEILKKSIKSEFYYLIYYENYFKDECHINIINETSFPKDKELIQIDRPRLTLIFRYEESRWLIKNIISWYG